MLSPLHLSVYGRMVPGVLTTSGSLVRRCSVLCKTLRTNNDNGWLLRRASPDPSRVPCETLSVTPMSSLRRYIGLAGPADNAEAPLHLSEQVTTRRTWKCITRSGWRMAETIPSKTRSLSAPTATVGPFWLTAERYHASM